jgi:hypothetical protein
MLARAQQSTGTKPPLTQRQKLKEYVAALQTNPDDYELRQQIMKLAATLKPPPAITDVWATHDVSIGYWLIQGLPQGKQAEESFLRRCQ